MLVVGSIVVGTVISSGSVVVLVVVVVVVEVVEVVYSQGGCSRGHRPVSQQLGNPLK